MSLPARRFLFLSLVILLTLQGIVIRDQGEPYPAVWAPAFAGGRNSENYTKPAVVFGFSDGSKKTVSQQVLLAQFPASHHGALMRFLEPLQEDRRVSRRLYLFFPGHKLGLYERESRVPEVADWLLAQSKRIFGREDLDWVRVHWYVYRKSDRQLVGTKGKYEIFY